MFLVHVYKCLLPLSCRTCVVFILITCATLMILGSLGVSTVLCVGMAVVAHGHWWVMTVSITLRSIYTSIHPPSAAGVWGSFSVSLDEGLTHVLNGSPSISEEPVGAEYILRPTIRQPIRRINKAWNGQLASWWQLLLPEPTSIQCREHIAWKIHVFHSSDGWTVCTHLIEQECPVCHATFVVAP